MSRLFVFLTALASVLSIVIVFELFGLPSDGLKSTISTSAPAQESGAVADTDGSSRSVAVILARPLFRADRRAPAIDRDALQSGRQTDLPRLAGIMSSEGAHWAIFQPNGGGRAIVLSEGETISGWRVQRILSDSVTLSGPGGTKTIEPKFAPASAGAGSNPPAPVPNSVNVAKPALPATVQQARSFPISPRPQRQEK